MSRDGKKTGGRNWAKGQSGNPNGLRKGTVVAANDFKDWCFDIWKKNKCQFEDMVLSDPALGLKFLQLISSFVPAEVKHTGEDGGPVKVIIEDAKPSA